MKLLGSIFAIILCLGQFSLAAPAKNKSSVINQLVERFYDLKDSQNASFTQRLLQSTKPMNHDHECDEPEGPKCVDVACEKLGAWGCDSIDEIKAVGKACRGNYDGICLGTVCDKLGAWGCDSLSEVTEVARACVGNHDMDCFSSVCQKLGAWGCDSLSEVTEVLQTCSGN